MLRDIGVHEQGIRLHQRAVVLVADRSPARLDSVGRLEGEVIRGLTARDGRGHVVDPREGLGVQGVGGFEAATKIVSTPKAPTARDPGLRFEGWVAEEDRHKTDNRGGR